MGGVLPHPANVTVQAVLYGFKAPVAMTLAPCFAEQSPHFKFVHVVRDGRDIAFSANQGPVNKFYEVMYGRSSSSSSSSSSKGKGRGVMDDGIHRYPGELKGIKLWSDWNSQIYSWADSYHDAVERMSTSSRSFGYFALHSEDLVSDQLSVKYTVISQLAAFVGSSLSPTAICCLVLQETEFMGSHDRSRVRKQYANAQLSVRYGKWRREVEEGTALFNQLHSYGKEGLQLFGYEPLRAAAEEGDQSSVSCSASMKDQCVFDEEEEEEEKGDGYKGGKGRRVPQRDDNSYSDGGMCAVVKGVDYAKGSTHYQTALSSSG